MNAARWRDPSATPPRRAPEFSDAALMREVRRELAAAGLRGAFLVRDLDSGREIDLAADTALPLGSVAKVPLAAAALDAIAAGHLDPAGEIVLEPGRLDTPGPTGASRFRHRATVALEDALLLAVAISDSSAADAVLDAVGIDRVRAFLRKTGVDEILVRHGFEELARTPAEELADRGLAHTLAIGAAQPGGAHPLRQLDIAHANVGTARALADLLTEIWAPTRWDAEAAARLRGLLAANVHRHRLAPEFASDATVWSSKTGTLLNLRHEVGVVEHADGGRIVVCALTESTVAAAVQPAAEAAMAHVARQLHDAVRDG